MPVYNNGDMTLDEVYDCVYELTGIDVSKTNGHAVYKKYEYSYTVEHIAEVYVKYIPEEYRVTAYDLNPELNPELTENSGKTK